MLSFPIFSSSKLGLRFLPEISVLLSRSEPVISFVWFDRLSEAIPSHPSGSSAWQQVRAIHSPLNRKGGRKFASPSRLVCRHLPNTPTGPTSSSPFDSSLPNVYDLLSPAVLQPHQSVVGAGRPSRFLRDQKTFGAGPCSFSS